MKPKRYLPSKPASEPGNTTPCLYCGASALQVAIKDGVYNWLCNDHVRQWARENGTTLTEMMGCKHAE